MNKNRHHFRVAELRTIVNAACSEWRYGCVRCRTSKWEDCGNAPFFKYYHCGEHFCRKCHPEITALADELATLLPEHDRRTALHRSKRAHRQELLQSLAEISPRFARCRFRNYIPREQTQADAVHQLQKWLAIPALREQHPLFLLHGAYGVGKTHLLRAAQRRIGYRECVSTFVNDVELSTAWQRAHNGDSGGDDPAEIVEHAKSADFLIWDDLGKVKLTDAWSRVLYEIINHRYEHLLPTLVSSNVEPANLGAQVGGATADRILDASNLIVPIRGLSMRGVA
jgi:DNA replication protein DnaC